MIFNYALVRRPGRSIANGLSTANLGQPSYQRALAQHDAYVESLQRCGLEVICLDPLEEFPDSTFVEDTAVLIKNCAILTAPGANSRRREVAAIAPVLDDFFPEVRRIEPPGQLDGGDVMAVDSCLYVGLSGRTNQQGIEQLSEIVGEYGLRVSAVPVQGCLHLKTGVTRIAERTLLGTESLLGFPGFADFEKINVGADSAAAANCIAINGKLLMPAGFPALKEMLSGCGREVIEVDISEFAKIDGGLTCLSLRF